MRTTFISSVPWAPVKRRSGGASPRCSTSSFSTATPKSKNGPASTCVTSSRRKAKPGSANASGKSVEKLAGIAGALNDKFKITAKQMPEALAMLMELASKGGIKFDELENFINTTGASALAAGLSGENGLKKMIAMANIGGDALKNMQKGVKTISSLFDSMVDPGVSKKIEQVFRVKTKDNAGNARDSTKVLEDIMARTKGEREKLAKVFSGEQLKLVVALSQDFVRGFNEQQGTTKEKLAHAREEFSQGLADAAKTANDYASIQKQANDRIDRDPAAAIRRATNKLGEAFLNPKMIGAIDRISAKLPELAEKLASFTEFAVDHPVAAGGAIIGGKVAAAVLPSVVGGAAVSVVKSIAATAKGAQAAGAIGQGFAGLGGTAAVAGTGTAAAGAGAGPLAAAAAFLGPIGAALAAVAGSGAAIYNGKKLYDENKGSGGILKNFGDAWNGRSSRASTPEEFDRMAREHAPPTTPRAAETEKVAESVKKHGHESDKAAASMARLGRESDRLASYFSTLGKATEAGPGGPSKGPRPLGAPGPGSAMKPPSA